MIGLVIHRDLVAPKASTSWRCFSKSTYSPMMPSPSDPQHNAATPSSMVGMVLFSLQASQFHYITVACVWPCWVAALVWLVLPLSRVLGVLWSVHTHLSQHLSLAFFPQTLGGGLPFLRLFCSNWTKQLWRKAAPLSIHTASLHYGSKKCEGSVSECKHHQLDMPWLINSHRYDLTSGGTLEAKQNYTTCCIWNFHTDCRELA